MISNTVSIENTRFIFKTNFSGVPDERFGDSRRRVNVVVSEELARELVKVGVNVRHTKPQEGEEENFTPTYFTQALLKYRDKSGRQMKFMPRVYLVSDDNEPILLNEDTVGQLDNIRVQSVDCVLNLREYEAGKQNLYIRSMYVVQGLDDDPYAAKYRRRKAADEDDRCLPFC